MYLELFLRLAVARIAHFILLLPGCNCLQIQFLHRKEIFGSLYLRLN